ncbi:hypothetical protein CERZMDRAFT_57342 [Cercospora zeae-maydis SCOH1-5]|uniref:RRM domain-containing protein n=1 Tax=Cercospora zeae-maydis SCOH1-5 TaxID=717836 RepID=A0A6A6FN13_9PEZI|nr:hypothetical protein CERZMDRAFT_57342 [Cercospora zeae-maydis SCOH1-5]
MFALRRVAARAIQCQPARQLSSIRCTPLTTRIEASKPTLYRSFHQSQRWFNDEEQKKADVSAAERAEVKEESIATSEVADAATDAPASTEDGVQQALQQEVKNATQAATDAVSSAAGPVLRTVASEGRAAIEFPGDGQSSASEPGKILYVGNLFFQVTPSELEAHFAQFGQVVNCRVAADQSGRSKGFGYIEFATNEEAARAISELDQKTFQGRRMAVQYHVRREIRPPALQTREPRESRTTRPPPSDNPPSSTLFIGNMSYQMTDRDLNDLFRDVKNILDVRVAIDRRSGQPRGFAHADFVDIASAERAKGYLSSKVVYGRELRVNYSRPSQNKEVEKPE